MELGKLKDKSNMAIYYKNMDVDISEEVLLYDFSAIVAAVGGSMGLFLGFSCYSLVLEFYTYCSERLTNCKKRRDSAIRIS